ncbi:hypothetical protein RJ639_035429 [Escallonia herrerae]|uniref:Uncharacterized protein n=1 Tax=Escallonia herrerae TaxID=1293975 RepID=A0AA88WRQ6_9ASTE|nr:hypothetical protein RJ639_035429 [Escallonia herrerae]
MEQTHCRTAAGMVTGVDGNPAKVMIHEPASSFYEAQRGEFIPKAEELLKLRETLTRRAIISMGKALKQHIYDLSDLVAQSMGGRVEVPWREVTEGQ